MVLPILETSGLKAGQDFFLAYSPEREDPGNPDLRRQQHPQGRRRPRRREPRAWRRRSTAPSSSASCRSPACEVAEACKILENTYRAVNIALVNELKVLFDRMGIDVWEVIEAAKTKPFGFQAFYPGPGLGGHCIPIDPFYLTWVARKHGLTTRFIELAGEINTAMPQYVVDRVRRRAERSTASRSRGAGSASWAWPTRRTWTTRASRPAFELMELLAERGAVVSYNDPHIPLLPAMRHRQVPPLGSAPLTAEFLAEQDCVLIVTDHSAYDYDFIAQHASLIIDTRNAMARIGQGRSTIVKA